MMIAGMRRLRSFKLVIFSSETYWLGHTGAFQGISVMKWHLRKDNSKVHGCRQEQNWDVNGSLQKGRQWIDRNMKIYILNFKLTNLHQQWSCKKQGHLICVLSNFWQKEIDWNWTMCTLYVSHCHTWWPIGGEKCSWRDQGHRRCARVAEHRIQKTENRTQNTTENTDHRT